MSVGNTMDTLSKLLNQAENAGTQAEADAFFERAQEWASRHAITLEQVRAHTAASQRREEPTHQQVVIGPPRQHVNGHLCLLASAIGQANGLRTNLASNNTFVLWFGLPSDIQKATMLLHAISTQMVRSADRFMRARRWVGELDWETGRELTGQKARKSYYTAYVQVIGRRLRQAHEQAKASFDAQPGEGRGSAELVLRGKEVEVADYYSRHSTARGTWRGNRGSLASHSAASTARQDASHARLSPARGIGGTRTAVTS